MRKILSKRSVLIVVLILIGGCHLFSRYQSSSKVLLKNCLGVEYSDEIVELKTRYMGGHDFSIFIYVEASPSAIQRILVTGGFEKEGYLLTLPEWPEDLPLPGDAGGFVTYTKDDGIHTYLQRAIVDETGTKLWYSMLDY